MSIAREGWPYIAVLLITGGLLCLRWPAWGGVVVFLGLFTAFFFRDPERQIPAEAALIVSPADGKVVKVAPAPEGNPIGARAVQVSIFLSIFDVHINRAPIAGRIVGLAYHRGEFLPAFDDRASLRNEQNEITLQEGSTRVTFKQIAGLIARRIVFRKRLDDTVEKGERVGLIKFGSRVDVFLAGDIKLRVKVGDRVQGGASVLGERP